MAIASTKAECFQCNKDKIVYGCEGCSNDFCINHLIEHRQILSQQLDRTGDDRDQFQQTIFEQKQNPQNNCLIEQINQWEQNSIDKIKQTAETCRLICTKYLSKHINNIEKEFVQLTELIRELRQENEFNEIDLNHLTNTLTKLNQEVIQPSNIFIQEDPSPSAFINKISVISSGMFKNI
jgi:chromosome segregation ATPase